jgi:hypothetical protein
MSCNWELFEFRALIMLTLAAKSGTHYLGLGALFWEVIPDLRTFGISDFQGSNDYCDFKSVFDQLAKLKRIHFRCPQKSNTGHQFGRIQAAERDKEHLPIAKLFVHRRDDDNGASDLKGATIWLQGVDVLFTVIDKDNYYVQLSGDSAGTMNI